MALQFIDGFDGIDVFGASGSTFEDNLKLKYEDVDVIQVTNPGLGTGRLGTGLALYWYVDSSGWLIASVTGSPTELIIGFAYRVPEDSRANKLVSVRNASSQEIVSLQIDYYNRLFVWNAAIRLAEYDEPLHSETWYYIEWKIVCHATNGSTEIRVNGETVSSATGVDTQSFAPPIAELVFWGQDNGSAYDDIYVCDTSGSVNNTFLGPSMIECLLPNADTVDKDFIPSIGADHYALVDEVPSDGGTTFVDGQVTGDQDIWDYENISEIDGTVHGVQVWTQAAATSGSYTLKTVADDGTTQDTDTGLTVAMTTYAGLLRAMDQTPSAGSWSASIINGSSFGVEVG